jgi:2-methylisocitrate lyase-like PEP mutase family enzyme
VNEIDHSKHSAAPATLARTAGYDREEALRRARAYREAGADAILIHSRRSTPDEILNFASHCSVTVLNEWI